MREAVEVTMEVLDWHWCDSDEECFVTLRYTDSTQSKPIIYKGIVDIENMGDLR